MTPSWRCASWVAGARLYCPFFWPVLPSGDCPRDCGPQAVALYSPAINTNCSQQWFVVMLWAVNSDGSGGETQLFSFCAEKSKTCAREVVWTVWGRGTHTSLVTPACLCAASVEGDRIWSMVISKIWRQLTENRKKKPSRHSCNCYALKEHLGIPGCIRSSWPVF